jgi:outer membrane protein, adhesin transport system
MPILSRPQGRVGKSGPALLPLGLIGIALLSGCATSTQTASCLSPMTAEDRMAADSGRGATCGDVRRDPASTDTAPLRLATAIEAEAHETIAQEKATAPQVVTVAKAPEAVSAAPAGDITGSIPGGDGAPSAQTAQRAVLEAGLPTTHKVASLSLPQAVALALSGHPRIGAQFAAVRGAHADVDRANAALYPSMSVSTGIGQGTIGSWTGNELFESGGATGAVRADVGLPFKQLVFDWGAARSEIQRTRSMALAEKLKLAEDAEKLALQTSNAYLKVIEQKQVLALIDQTLADYEGLSRLVSASQQDGNGTMADVQKIKARMVEIRSMRSDIDTDMSVALNEFRRLTAVDAKTLKPPRDISSALPVSFERAMRDALDNNPALLAYGETSRAFGAQKDSVEASQMPRVDLVGDGLLKNYSGVDRHSELDARAMVMVSYKLLDGGLAKAQSDRADADLERSRYQIQDHREQLELDLRRAFQSRKAADQKYASISTGVEAARSVKELQLEQFRNGKKSVFELIDSYMSYFTLRRQLINSQYDKLRGAYEILRTTGRLNDALARQPS